MLPWTAITHRPRRLLLLFLGFVTLAAAGGYFLWRPRPHDWINDESFARIKPGMSRAELEAVLGGPARNESAAGDGTVWNYKRVEERWGDWLIPAAFRSSTGSFLSNEEWANQEKARLKGAELYEGGKYLLVWHHDQAIIGVVFDGGTDRVRGARLWKPQEKTVRQVLRERWLR